MLNLLKSKLRLIAKTRNISDYKSVSKNELINAINYQNQQKIIKRIFLNQKEKRFKRFS